jgi:hypothetical protein
MYLFFSCRGVEWGWVHLVRRPLLGQLYHLWVMTDDHGAFGIMRICRGNRSATLPITNFIWPVIWDRNQVPSVGSRQLTTWAMVRSTSDFHVGDYSYCSTLSYDTFSELSSGVKFCLHLQSTMITRCHNPEDLNIYLMHHSVLFNNLWNWERIVRLCLKRYLNFASLSPNAPIPDASQRVAFESGRCRTT